MTRWFSKYITILTLVPGLLLVSLGILNVEQSIVSLNEAKLINQASLLSQVSSNLVHEMQKERGMSAGYRRDILVLKDKALLNR